MKKLAASLLVFLLALTLNAQDEMQDNQQAEAMKAWQEFMTPGEMQKKLAEGAGEWSFESKAWYGPDTEPVTSDGSATGEMILGGRYLRTNHSGNYMGMPFEGISVEAYDKSLKKFISTWIDNFGTGVTYAEGEYDPKSNMIVYEGKMTDPMKNEKVWFKQTMKFVDDNTNVLVMYAKDPEGNVYKNMEITFTRK